MTIRLGRLLVQLCAISFLAAPLPTYAAGAGVVEAKVTVIHLESGTPYLQFNKPIGNPDSCASNVWALLPADLPNQQGYLSLATTALAAGKSVSVWIDGCGWAPWAASVPKVYAMQIVP